MRMKRKGIAVLSVVVMLSVMLVACGGGNSGDSGDASGGGDEKELNVLCFQGYTEPEWVESFEKEYNVKVNATYAGTVEEMFTKAAAGGNEYDVVSIDCGSVQRYYDADLLEPIDVDKIPNYDKLSQFFKDADYKIIDGNTYQIPLCWGSNNLVYNKDTLPDFADTWEVLWDPKYKDQVSVTDEANNNVVVAAISLGFEDPYNLTPEQLEQCKDRLIEIVKNCRTFSNGYDNEFQLLSTGETNASISGYDSGLIMKLRDEAKMNVGRLMPEEGIYAWIDGWVMLKGVAHPDLAVKWMDWMLSDESQIALAKMMSFGAVTPAAKEGLDPDVVTLTSYDNIDNIKVPVFVMQTPEDFDARVEIWNEAKAAK